MVAAEKLTAVDFAMRKVLDLRHLFDEAIARNDRIRRTKSTYGLDRHGYAMMNGLTLDSIFVERGVSGSKPLGERSEGARLLAGLNAGDVVITPKLDRMFRSALDALDVLGQLKDRGVSLHMIDLGGT